MANGWLVYQTLCCRLWARSAFYQSGGAFGFRDQLQDAAALIHLRPELTRAQILRHAAHQFVEGDVLHWWHPPESRGIRTRFADDLLWLPLITADYIATTGEGAILDEQLRFLRARPLAEGEDEAFLLPEDSGERAKPLRALLPGARPLAHRGRARSAADGNRRLERRHEPGRARGPRRERLARFLPPRDSRPVRPAVPGARRWGAGGALRRLPRSASARR